VAADVRGRSVLPTTDPKSLSILLTNITLATRSGTETVTRDLAIALLRAGHRPMVYSPRLGPIAEEIRRVSIPVTDDILSIRDTPDVIHGHHVIQTAVAATRFPNTPAIFVCHDFMAWHDQPPHLPNIRGYVSISEAFRTRLTVEGGLDPSIVEVIPNGVDTSRFLPGPRPPRVPKRALVFAKNHGHLEAITAACAQRGIAIDTIGSAVDRQVDAPERLLPTYDLVFCSALTAIEAMAALRPVIVCDGRGLAGLATQKRYDAWRRENFGLRTFSRPVTVEAILEELDLYDPADAVVLGKRVRREADLGAWAGRYVSFYRRVIQDHATAPPTSQNQTAQATALHMQTWNPAFDIGNWMRERQALLATIDRLDTGLALMPLHQRVEVTDQLALALTGFHPLETWGAWSAHRACSVRFRIGPEQTFKRISIELRAFFTPTRTTYTVRCGLDGRSLGVLAFDDTAADGPWLRATLELPESIEGGQHWLTFETDECVSPKSAGLSFDSRELGVGLIAVKLD
jgi:glycosyltransferase involved in cell wall biosynthesis